MKLLAALTFFFLLVPASAQRRVILSSNSSGWAYTRVLADDNRQFKPEEADPDFWPTWIDHSFGGYSSPLTYDGPPFITNQQAPFSAGNVPGIQGGTSLDLPADATWQYAYFLKEINGGTTGFQNLNLKVLARDGAVLYLNGHLLGYTPGTSGITSSSAPRFTTHGDGVTFQDINLYNFRPLRNIVRPGPNLLAIVAGRTPGQTDNFGLKVELTGEPGIPPITPISEYTIDNRIHLQWATAVPQKTLVRITPGSNGNEFDIFESATATRNHHFVHEVPYSNAQNGNSYSYSILKPDLQLWQGDFVEGFYASASFTAPGFERKTLFTHEDTEWRYLQTRDPNGNDIDPADSDPDFHQSWFQQFPSEFGIPPFMPLSYDGPEFTQTATPIHYGIAHEFSNLGTELTPPTGGEGHTLWLLRNVDGGSSGYRNVELSLRLRGEATVFLNGKLLNQTDNNTSDSWPFPANDWQYTRTKTIAASYLNPGPNLLAVAVHNAETNLSHLGFSSRLSCSMEPPPIFRDLKESLFGNTFSLSYLTGIPQPTVIKIGPVGSERVTYEIPGDRVFHQFRGTNFEENTTYSYEITVPNPNHLPFEPPTRVFTGDFTPTSTTIINQASSNWQILHSLDNNDSGTDPALTDPDFNTTWMTLGMPDSPYDGPTFTPNQSAPFRISGIEAGFGGTSLTHPGESHSGALYLVKEITGFEKGAWSLDFNLTTPRAYRVYLNGELIIDDLGLNQPDRSWDLYWQHQDRRPTHKPASLLPGKNILAISLHPQNQNTPALDLDLTLTGLTDFGDTTQMSPLSTPTPGDTTTTIQWFTDTPSGTTLRYGPSRNDLGNSIALPAPTCVHTVHLPNPAPGQRLYYEILQTDGSSYNPPAIDSFVAPPKTLLPFSSAWSYLDLKAPGSNASMDPALLDPDFYETWTTQSLGSYPGNGIYDGPPFSPLLPAPFGPPLFNSPPGTITPDFSVRWFIKEVDGGTTGYHQLQMTGIRETPMTVFLNGSIIGNTNSTPATQPIWAQRGGRLNTSPYLPIPQNLILPPGPNLIAVLLHLPYNSQHHTFDLQLTGLPLENTNTIPHAINTSSTSVDLTWSTSSPQPSLLRWGTSLSSLSDSTEIPGDRTYHTLTLTNLTPSTNYFVEVLDTSGNSRTPPVLASFRTNDHLLVSRQSSGWSLLESIIDNTFVDPATNDPDFLTTWHTPSTYDGPAFLPNQSAPFITQGKHLRLGQTHLQTIDDKIRPVWLLKEIDGGTTGYQFLTLDAIYDRSFAAFLNGELIAFQNLQNNDQFGSWNLHSSVNASQNSYSSLKLPGNITVNPGPNTLAIALHPTRFDLNGSLTGEFELRGVPQRLEISQVGVTYPNFNLPSLNWTTSQPTTFTLNYGLEPGSFDYSVENPELKTNHQSLPLAIDEGGTYYFEIVATDALGNTVTSIGSFQILPQMMRRPFLQKAAPTSMTVNWRTRGPGETLLQFGQDPANLSQIISGTSSLAPLIFTTGPNEIITDHSVTLRNLTPATKYYYQIAAENSPAPATDLDQFFTTPPLPGTPAATRIWVIGDSGYAGQRVLDVKDAYLQYTADTPTDVWLMLGDNAYGSGTDSQYQAGVFNTFPELLKNTPVWPTMGNHDGYTKQYYGIFDLPTDGISGGVPSGTEKYYSFDHGNIHFICLNSEEDPVGMTEWMKIDLQSTRADWIIAFFHHGPYTKGSHDSDRESEHFQPRQRYLPILEDYGVDLVLSGHSHQYERSHLLNGHYFTSATYSADEHALDSGPGSPLGHTDRNSGLFHYTSEYGPYQKPLATPNSGQVSATVGASSSVGRWSDTNGGNSQAITHPNPHPVHVATLRALGSMVIDVHDQTLQACYLDANGRIRDHFEIQKSPDTGPAIRWWQDHFGPGSYPRFPDWFADTDNDTHNNFAEYAHGGDPFVDDQLIEAVLTAEEDQNDQLSEWFTVQYKLREGTKVSVQASHNLIQFTDSGVETRRLTEPDANGLARWEARVRRTNQRALFFRILVSR